MRLARYLNGSFFWPPFVLMLLAIKMQSMAPTTVNAPAPAIPAVPDVEVKVPAPAVPAVPAVPAAAKLFFQNYHDMTLAEPLHLFEPVSAKVLATKMETMWDCNSRRVRALKNLQHASSVV